MGRKRRPKVSNTKNIRMSGYEVYLYSDIFPPLTKGELGMILGFIVFGGLLILVHQWKKISK